MDEKLTTLLHPRALSTPVNPKTQVACQPLSTRLQKTTCCLLRGYPKIDSFLACFSSPGHGFGRDLVEMKPTDVPHLPI